MKRVLGIIVIAFCLLSCESNVENGKETIVACGVDDPEENIVWLANLIQKAKNDKSGNYIGTIWLEKYNGNDIFVTDMAMGSGAVAYYFFDCKGNSFVPESIFDMAYNVVVYTNVVK